MNQRTATLKKSEELRRGDILIVFGVGQFSISGFRKIGQNEVLVKLAWAELAVTARRGQTWQVIPAPDRQPHP